jgi:hypothetical protein
MAGKIDFIQPLGHDPYGDNHNSTQLPQQYGSVIFGAGSLTASSGYGFQPSLTQSVPVAPVGNPPSAKSNRAHLDTAAPASGNRGGVELYGGGKFDQMQPGQYVMQGAMKDLAGSGNTLLNSPQKLSQNGRNANNWHGDELTGITGWDYQTGAARYNAAIRGNAYEGWSPLTNTSGVLEPTPTITAAGANGIAKDAVPGTLVFNFNGQVPASSVYGPRYDN